MGPGSEKPARALAAFREFFEKDLNALLEPGERSDGSRRALATFHRAAARVPAYAAFLSESGIDAGAVRTTEDLARVPATTKENYHRRHALAELCVDGRASDCDMLAVSSGSTGEPAIWPRFVSDELATAVRFEQVLEDAFDASNTSMLGVVCFALGSWVGGMYTAACCRQLAAKGYPLTLVTPGNNKAEILRVFRALAPSFEQIVLFGYPPFLKDVIDSGRADGLDWKQHRVRLVMAGEVFSEAWRSLVSERLGAADPAFATASLYGTADGGVLANETPWSVRIRRALAAAPDAARELFGESRLPTLCQYDPCHRYFEVESDGSLLFTADGSLPLVRYKILDRGGVVSATRMREFLHGRGLDVGEPERAREQPFVYVFGRSNFALSFYGANVYPENVAVGIEQQEFGEYLTGKFVMQVLHDAEQNPRLAVAVELSPGAEPGANLAHAVARVVRRELERSNSEFCNYAPPERRTPDVTLYPHAHSEFFPLGVKHRYTRH
jgi:phenylacetate-CoA ligase